MFFYSLFVFVIGLVFGSFANVLIYRLPKGKKITGRSMCPGCKNQINWFDNIPLLSYFLLRGKCRNCKKSISLRYPLIELITGILFVLLFLRFGSSLDFIYWTLLTVIFVSVFAIDFTYQIIPDELVFSGIIISLLRILFADIPLSPFNYLMAGFSASLFLLILHLITNGKGMGLGDVKFAILGGLALGLTNFLYWLFLAFLTGGLVGCILILFRKLRLKSKIVFGPFLIIALYLVVFFKS